MGKLPQFPLGNRYRINNNFKIVTLKLSIYTAPVTENVFGK